ncbi:TPA: HEPN domain-containing protein [Clostridium perfringens]
MQGKRKVFGKATYVNEGVNMANVFLEISQEDERAANILFENKQYNQAVYFCIQAMEKYVKFFICQKVDISNKYFANKIRETGHSIDNSIDFLIEIVAGNDKLLREQISNQIRNQIFQGEKLSRLYNAVRYPFYYEKSESYKIVNMSKRDCEEIFDMLKALKRMLQDLNRI